MTDLPQTLVLIPTLNEERYIAGTLEQLIEGDPLASTCPILVADGGSTDRTRNIVKTLSQTHPNIRLIDNPGRTQAAAMNLLLSPEFDGSNIFIRCDAHADYPPRFVSSLVAKLSEVDAASVVIPMDAISQAGCFQKGLAWIADSKLGAGGSAHRGGTKSGFVDHGHHAAFRASAFRKLSGYDTNFVANEDAEFDRRLIEAGERIWLESDIRIGYYPRASAKGLWRQYFNYGQGRAQTCLKHLIRPKLRQLIPVVNVLLLALSLIALPFTSLSIVWPALYLFLLVIVSLSTALTKHSACGLIAGLALGIMHLAWGLGFLVRLAKGRPHIPASPVSQT
ncbi:glycosyltransferase family 2 protein [Aestuariibius insulae]|uniref:glycosyltransferase family 2 protein n=1 Tax=Aestuariibius insulae TaxID=2058287 RepID=UPI00398E5E18